MYPTLWRTSMLRLMLKPALTEPARTRYDLTAVEGYFVDAKGDADYNNREQKSGIRGGQYLIMAC